MAGLEESVGIDFSQAIQDADSFATSAAESLDAALQAAVEQFASSLAGAAQDAGTSVGDAVAAALASAASEIPVGVDTAQADSEVSAFVARVDAETPTIDVQADTTEAEAELDQLAESADQLSTSTAAAGEGTQGLADHTSFLSGVAGVATGELGGLDSVTRGVGGGTAIAAGGVLALGAGVGVLVSKGLEAESALQRFNFIVGDMADEVLHVNVGTLNEDLDHLAIKLGTDDEALRSTNATLFQFALNSGASRTESAEFANEITALAARAVALNPELGSVADVADSLATRLARGGRFAASYGVSLTAAEIETRALGNTHKAAASDLTIYEKSQAAVQIAVEKYGDTLGTTVAEGAKNAVIEQRSLKEQLDNVLESAGKPLVVPFLEAFRQSIPVVEELAPPLGRIALSILPALADVLEIVAPPLRVVASILEATPEPILAAATAAVILTATTTGLRERLFGVAVAEEAAAVGAGEMAVAQEAAAVSSTGLTASSLTAGQAGLVAAAGIGAYVGTTELLKAAWGDSLNTQFADQLDEIDAKTKKLASTTDSTLLPKFRDLVEVQIKAKEGYNKLAELDGKDPVVIGSKSVESLVRFKELAHDSYDAAVLLVAQMRANGDNTDLYQAALDRLAPKQRDNAAATKAANDQVTLLTGSYTEQLGVLDQYITKLDAIYDAESSVAHAQDSAEDSLQHLIDARLIALAAGGQDAAANEAASRALLDVEDAYRRVGEQVRAKSEKENEALGPQEASRRATYDQITALQGLTDKLAPGDPLRVYLEEYIGKLLAASGVHAATLTLDASQAFATIDDYIAAWGRASEATRGLAALGGGEFINPNTTGNADLDRLLAGHAMGGYIEPQPGGVGIKVAEAGYPEVVVSPRNIAGAAADLQRLGVLDQLKARVPSLVGAGASAGGRVGGAGEVWNIDKVVLEQASPNPTREVMRAARQVRHGARKATWS